MSDLRNILNITTGKLALGMSHLRKDDVFVIMSESPDLVWVALEDPKMVDGVMGCMAKPREKK